MGEGYLFFLVCLTTSKSNPLEDFIRGFSYEIKMEVFVMSKTNNMTKRLITLAILSALGSALMWFEIPLIPPFKLDASDSAVLIGGVLYGPLGAIIVALIKSVVHFIFISSGDFGVGEFIAFVASMSYVLPFIFSLKLIKKVTNNSYIMRIVPGIIGTLSLTTILFFFNIAVSFQLWSYVMFNEFMPYSKIVNLSISFIPGNLIKGVGLTIIFFILSFRLDYVAEKLCGTDKPMAIDNLIS